MKGVYKYVNDGITDCFDSAFNYKIVYTTKNRVNLIAIDNSRNLIKIDKRFLLEHIKEKPVLDFIIERCFYMFHKKIEFSSKGLIHEYLLSNGHNII